MVLIDSSAKTTAGSDCLTMGSGPGFETWAPGPIPGRIVAIQDHSRRLEGLAP